MSEERRAVAPIRPAAAYIGRKRRLRELLARRIEAVPHETYAEPFVGMGGYSSVGDGAAARGDQRHLTGCCDAVSHPAASLSAVHGDAEFQITSRAEFERLAASYADALTDLERAGRFLYLQRLASGGKFAGRNFGIETAGSSRFDVTKLGPIPEDIHRRLRRRRDRASAMAGLHRPSR